MKRVVVWFNHWFSTAYHIIRLLKEDTETDFYVIGTGHNPDSVVRRACDAWYDEPDTSTDEIYVNACLDFCRAHAVEVFVPRHGQLAISRRIAEFAAIGVKVLVGDCDTLATLQDKQAAYALFERLHIGLVPPHRIVTTAESFAAAYVELSAQFDCVCMKFVRDEGGMSFRVIDDSVAGYAGLHFYQGAHLPYAAALAALSEQESFPPLMLMPYLPDEEVSVDCLRTAQGVVMLPRAKSGGRIEEIRFDDDILAYCADFYEKVGIECPCNIQFKYRDGTPYFLEVNTRMSGGVYMGCLATGVNIPNLAVNRLLGIEKPWTLSRTNKRFTQIETPVFL